jgi:hypothetical protein
MGLRIATPCLPQGASHSTGMRNALRRGVCIDVSEAPADAHTSGRPSIWVTRCCTSISSNGLLSV